MSIVVPSHGKAGIARNPGAGYTVEMIHDYPVPQPAQGQLLLKLNCSGLCLSDHHFMSGDWGIPMECKVAGHEGAGVVVAIGAGVDGWKLGDRAGIKPISDVCHQCDQCREGREAHCDKATFSGATSDGSYAEYVITPARYTTRIPHGVSDEIAGPIMCSGATVYTAIKNSGAKPGEWVVIPGGGGGVGSMGIQYAKAMGMRVIAIDTGADKKTMCLALGAEAFVDFKEGGAVEKVKALTAGMGAHAVIVTGSTPAAYAGATSFLRKGGVQVCVGMPAVGTAIAGADPFILIFNGLKVIGSLVATMKDTDEALDFAARGLINPHINVIPFAELPDGLKKLSRGEVAGRLVMDFNK